MKEYGDNLAESTKIDYEPDLNSTDVGMKRIQSDYSIGGEANFYEPLLVPLFYDQLNKAGRKQFFGKGEGLVHANATMAVGPEIIGEQ